MVPEAGLEPARPHQTLDFECLLNPFVSLQLGIT